MGRNKNKETVAWRNNPFTFKASESLIALFKKNVSYKRKALMCRNCGCVFIAGGDVLRGKNTGEYIYCDRECAYADRSRVYKANWEQHVSACEKTGKRKKWPHSNVYKKNCTQCSTAFYAQYQWKLQCSDQCVQSYKQEISQKHKKTAAIKNSLAYRQKKIRDARKNPKTSVCIECETVFTPILYASTRKFCSAGCARRNHKRSREHVRRERMKLPVGTVRGKTSIGYIIKKFKGKCCCCKQAVTRSKEYQPNQATVDHIVPLSKGGLHIEDNLQLLCIDCNAQKSDTIQIENTQLALF